MPSPSPLLGTPLGERRGPGRGRLPALEEPPGGAGGGGPAPAVPWPGRRHHVSHPEPRGPPRATPGDCSPDPAPGRERSDGAAGPGGTAGATPLTPTWAPSRGGRSRPPGRRGKQARQLSLGWVGGWPWPRGAAGNARPPPAPAGSRSAGREAAGHPGLPSHPHTAPAAAKAGGGTDRAVPAPWTDGDVSAGRANSRDVTGAAGGLRGCRCPGTRCPRGNSRGAGPELPC